MNFDFSEEQYLFRDNVRTLLEKEWSVGQVRAAGGGGGHDHKLWTQLVDLGLPAMLVGEDFGGMNMTILDVVLLFEEFGRRLVPRTLVETMLATHAIQRFGTTGQHADFLPGIAAGELIVVAALAERSRGHDPGDVGSLAIRTPDGWALAGEKIMVQHADLADLILISACKEDGSLGLFLVERSDVGVSLTPSPLLDPSIAGFTVSLNVRLPLEAELGIGTGSEAALHYRDLAAAAAASEMIGATSGAFDLALDFAKLRVQFGQTIGAFQAIKHKFADMFTALEASRCASYYAAWSLDEDRQNSYKAINSSKSYAGDSCRFICNETLQIHGGIGYTWEHDLHFYIKRAKMLEYMHGDANWHREALMSSLVGGGADRSGSARIGAGAGGLGAS